MAKSEQIITDPTWWLENRGIPYSPEVYVGFLKHGPIDEGQREILRPLLTNLHWPIFAFTDYMPQEVGAAAMTRYSRAVNPLRLVLADEFLEGHGMNLTSVQNLPSLVNRAQAHEFYSRILSGYGDDSPSQLGTVQLAMEYVSQIAVKEIEDGRVGVAFIEKSSRYIDFTKRVNGEYLFLRPKEIMDSPYGQDFMQLMNESFSIFSRAYPELLKLVREKFPFAESDHEAWKAATRSKALDIIRVFLPMATLTNVGGIFTGQALESAGNKMLTSWSHESRTVARDMIDESDEVIGSLTQRINLHYGEKARKFLTQSNQALIEVARELRDRGLIADQPEDNLKAAQIVRLTYASQNNVDRVVAGLLYPRERISQTLVDQISALPTMEKKRIIDAGFSSRENRRHKPHRAFEKAVYEFHVRSKVGEWRDLQRMRMNTLQRQLFTTEIGFVTPPEFFEVDVEFNEKTWNLAELYESHMLARSSLYRKISNDISPEVAQFVVAFGNLMDWEISVNLRQLYHLIPLRAGPGSHPDYRQIALNMFFNLPPEDALLTFPMTDFLDLSDQDRLDRLAQLNKVREKQLRLGVTDRDTFSEED